MAAVELNTHDDTFATPLTGQLERNRYEKFF